MAVAGLGSFLVAGHTDAQEKPRAVPQSWPPPDSATPIAPQSRASSRASPPNAPGAPIFHFGLDYGSESQFDSFNVIVSVGLCSFGRLRMADDRLFDADWRRGWSRLGDAYTDPVGGIQEGSTTKWWLLREFAVPVVFPLHPNVYFHFLGEGMVTRKLEEYYLQRGYSRAWSKALAITTMSVAQQVNEASEQQSPIIDKGDSLADVFFWNIAGILAFQNDGFARLFSNPSVSLYFWPGQAVLNVRDGTLYNHGEHYALRTTLGAWTSWRLAYVSGIPQLFAIGPSVPLGRHDWLTVAAGVYHDFPRNSLSVPLSIYWDRKGSLMANLVARTDLQGYRLNVYPVVEMDQVKFGMYADVHADQRSSVGLTLSLLPIVPGGQF